MHHTHNAPIFQQRPLLKLMDDQRVEEKATRIRYEFWRNGYVHGNIYAERDFTSGAVLAKFEGVGTDDLAVSSVPDIGYS
jgi:hypothetical protein